MKRVNEWIYYGTFALQEAGIENAAAEARWLFEDVSGFDRMSCISNAAGFIPDEIGEEYACLIRQRKQGRPLQYILGKWEFFGREFFVGEGVLIPRPETEMLVEFALEYIKSKKDAVVVDLCAGSGCIGLTLAAQCPQTQVMLLEYSRDAVPFLQKNLSYHGIKNAHIICGDIFDGPQKNGIEKCDVLLSNPPYIATAETSLLQKEVLREPVMALDGGKDGLDFYRAILEKWMPVLSSKGFFAVECGEEQTETIARMMRESCFDIQTHKDIYSLPRAVTGCKK